MHAIDPARLDAVRDAGEDGWGNPFTPYAASGHGEPLRCCLRFARRRRVDRADLLRAVHSGLALAGGRAGVRARRALRGVRRRWLPAELRRGPRVLRTYRADGSMNYEHNTLVGDEDLEPVLDRLLSEPDVATVHVRTVLPQCFLYAVTR